jgi:uncharacterized protein YkwD
MMTIAGMRLTPSSWIVTHLHGRAASAFYLSLILALALWVAPAHAQSVDPDAESEIVRLVNAERQSRGLATLIVDERLLQAARKHSAIMASTGEVEHQIGNEPRLTVRLSALRFDTSGENVALAATPARVHAALMNSPGHRANILDAEYNSIGIGVIRGTEGLYVTEDFARRLPDASVGEAESQIASSLNRIRRAANRPILARLPAPQLRQYACEMASRDRLNPKAALSLPNVGNAVAFTATDLTQLPDSFLRLRSQSASAFSVGACYQSSASSPTPLFWILVVTYF